MKRKGAVVCGVCVIAGFCLGYGSNVVLPGETFLQTLMWEGISRRAPKYEEYTVFWQGGENKGKLLNKLFLRLRKRMNPEDWETELKKILDAGKEDNSEYEQAFRLLFCKWVESDPETALARLDSLDGSSDWEQTHIKDGILSHWASLDPRGAARYFASSRRSQKDLYHCQDTIAEELAKISPDESWEWIKSIKKDTLDNRLNMRFLDALVKTAPGRMREFLDKAKEEELAWGFFLVKKDWLGLWCQADRPAWESWVSSLSEDMRGQAKDETFQSIAASDPQWGKERLEQDKEYRKPDNIKEVLQTMPPQKETFEWLMRLTPSEGGDVSAILSSCQNVYKWFDQAPDEAESWITALPAGMWKDEFALFYARGANSRLNMEQRMAPAQFIADRKKRMEALRVNARSLYQKDPEKACKWLDNYAGPAEDKDELYKAMTDEDFGWMMR